MASHDEAAGAHARAGGVPTGAEGGGAVRELSVEIRTPDGPVWSGPARSVTVPGTLGSMGILARHAPLMSSLDVGLTKIVRPDGATQRYVTGLGFVEVYRNHVLLLVDFADDTAGIDVERAKAARDRALARLRPPQENVDQARAEAALKRALMRLRFAGQPRI